MSCLDGKLLLLASQPGPHIGLHPAGGSPLKQGCEQGIAGCPSQVLAQLSEQDSQVVVNADDTFLGSRLLPEAGDYDDSQKPAA